MPYSTIQDVLKHLPELDDPDVPEFQQLIEKSIAQADSDIDSALCSRYAVPFPMPYPEKIVTLSADRAASYAALDTSSGSDATKQGALLKDQSDEALKRLQLGKDSIPGARVSARIYAGNSNVTDPALKGWCW